MIQICVLGVVLFYSLFFYTVIKFQHTQKIHAQGLDA
jgi:hypothetical protein